LLKLTSRDLINFASAYWGHHVLKKDKIIGHFITIDNNTNLFGCYPERQFVLREKNHRRCEKCRSLKKCVTQRKKEYEDNKEGCQWKHLPKEAQNTIRVQNLGFILTE